MAAEQRMLRAHCGERVSERVKRKDEVSKDIKAGIAGVPGPRLLVEIVSLSKDQSGKHADGWDGRGHANSLSACKDLPAQCTIAAAATTALIRAMVMYLPSLLS